MGGVVVTVKIGQNGPCITLLGKVVTLLANDQRDGRLHEGYFQAIIDEPTSGSSPSEMSSRQYRRFIAYWEKRFPGKGEAIAVRMKRFVAPRYLLTEYSWNYGIDLDQSDFLRRAIFWREFKTVRGVGTHAWRIDHMRRTKHVRPSPFSR